MVAEDVVESPRAALPYAGRLVVTLVLIGLYFLGHRVPLPFVDADSVREVAPSLRLHLLTLGVRPLVTGFLLVELFALLTSPGRRLRRGGVAGRARLNRAALGTSLILTAIQAWGLAMALERMPISGVSADVPGFAILLTATLTAVTAGLFLLGNLISIYGIANGFALLVLMEIVFGLLNRLPSLEEAQTPEMAAGLLLIGVLAGLLVLWFQRAEPTYTAAFPQGVGAVGLAASLLAVSFHSAISRWPLGDAGSLIASAVFYLLAIPILSWLGFLLFSTRRRIAAELPETDQVVDELAALLKVRLLPSAALLAAGAAGLAVWSYFQPRSSGSPAFWMLELLLAVAVALDVFDQLRFSRRNPDAVQLAQLDDVHFAYRLAERMAEEGIDALARGIRFRSLFYFFGPLYKIDLLVPAGDLDAARGVLAELESFRELKVF
jgi:hypothetical protein